MKVLLVKPYNQSDHIQPSLGLGYLASALRKENEVVIVDCIKERLGIKEFANVITEQNPDLIGFQCYTFDLKIVKKYLELSKGISPKIVTVVGGPHSSAIPDETMSYFGDKLDFAFVGEAEKGLSALVGLLREGEKKDFSSVFGLVWRQNGKVIKNNCFIEDNLDSLGIPAWDLIRPETYPESQHGAFFQKFPIAPVMITRGCPYQCTFCASKTVSGSKLRKRSVSNVIDELKILYKKHGIREFHIVDDNFTLDRNYAKAVLKELISQKWDISIATPNGIRMDTLDEELLELFKKSGLYLVSLGIESGSDRILKLMKKNLDIAKIRESVNLIRRFGFDMAGFFILGFPRETKEEIFQTIKLSRQLGLVRANFFNYLPFPGTESYRELQVRGQLKYIDWDRFYFTSTAYVPEGISRRELKWLQRLAFASFYLRPNILLRNLKGIKSFRHLYFLLRRFFHWVMLG